MPELPEVETVARSLGPHLTGAVLTGAEVSWPRMVGCPDAAVLSAMLAGRRVQGVGRRGKYVVLSLDRGYLLFHLKMSGRLKVTDATEPAGPHLRAVFPLADGRQLRFEDARKFGRIYLVEQLERVTAPLGPEPLSDELSPEEFQRLLARRSGRVKSLLLNQEFLAGLGNIYADEVLFAARLHPLRLARSLTPEEQQRLYQAIRTVLARAVASGGTTLRDRSFLNPEGHAGAFQEEVAVYGRAGDPCPRCGEPIERIVIGGRSAHFCPHCQAP
jgi:formamidopyrimidine-DNA glycosylase